MFVYFDVQHLYYLPQYLPVVEQLLARGHEYSLVFYRSQEAELNSVSDKFITDNSLNVVWLDSKVDTLSFYQNNNADWVIFGNAFLDADKLNKKSVLMQHGIGPKQCYYDVSNTNTTVRFVEGEHRQQRLKLLYPDGEFIDTGYAKLDPLFNGTLTKLRLSELGLDEKKTTLLYAPTFYPSSIECMSDQFPEDFSDYNIIIKPHFFSVVKPRYKKQKQKLLKWQKYNNVYLTNNHEFNLTPFLDIADIMLSDASSAIFEFAALDKPVVWCDFYKLRWSYRGFFAFRLKARLDEDIHYFNKICHPARGYKELALAISDCKSETNEFKQTRAQLIEQLAGKTDGLSALRIVNYLERH